MREVNIDSNKILQFLLPYITNYAISHKEDFGYDITINIDNSLPEGLQELVKLWSSYENIKKKTIIEPTNNKINLTPEEHEVIGVTPDVIYNVPNYLKENVDKYTQIVYESGVTSLEKEYFKPGISIEKIDAVNKDNLILKYEGVLFKLERTWDYKLGVFCLGEFTDENLLILIHFLIKMDYLEDDNLYVEIPVGLKEILKLKTVDDPKETKVRLEEFYKVFKKHNIQLLIPTFYD